jgi:hypothetical protein
MCSQKCFVTGRMPGSSIGPVGMQCSLYHQRCRRVCKVACDASVCTAAFGVEKGARLFGEGCLMVLNAGWHPSCRSYAARLLKAVNT